MRTLAEAVAYHRAALAAMPAFACRRVQLRGLVAKPELNTRTGRVLSFNPATGRSLVRVDPLPPAPAGADSRADEAPPSASAPGGSGATAADPHQGSTLALKLENLQVCDTPITPSPPLGAPKPQADGSPHRQLWRAHTYALANALWELETQEAVAEALELAGVLLDEDYADEANVRNFAIDLLFEAGRWQEALNLLHRYGHDGSGESSLGPHVAHTFTAAETWAWHVALLKFRLYGLNSKRAAEAVATAIDFNPYVYPLLVGDKLLGDEAHMAVRGMRSLSYVRGMRPFGDERSALAYVWNSKRYWWDAGGGEAMISTLRKAGEAPYLDWQRRYAAARGSGPPSREPQRDVSLPTMHACACCRAVGPGYKACMRCRAVRYCGRECQAQHWKRHKAECTPGAPAAAD